MSNTKGTTAINSPQGGGALSGLGEKFSPDLYTGTGNFSVPIVIPPGRNGFQPELTLGYSTGTGNGVFGSGWSLGLSAITRKTSKGIPIYDDKADIFILSGAEDMVPVKVESQIVSGVNIEKTYYRPRTEGVFARIIRYKKSNGEHYWEVKNKDGLVSYYGTFGMPGDDPRVLANPEKRDSIFSWYLYKMVDPFGNEIVYTYDRDLVTSGSRQYDQLYISQIDYTKYQVPNITPPEYKYLCQIKFIYEDRVDSFSTYKQGFEVRTTRRCSKIELWTDATAPIKTKTYYFEYNNDSLNGISLLKSVNVEGHNGSESEFMPPLEFKYSVFNPQKRDLIPITGSLPGVSLANSGFELVDLNGNGLPDILQLNGISRRWPNLGNGKFGNPVSIDIAPSIQLGMPGIQLIDADGDGKSDLLVNDGTKAGYFPGRFRTVWDNKSFRPYPQIPSFRFDDPEVKLIDLDGDGITDVLRNGSRFECFFNDPEKGFYKTRFTNKTFADFSFSDSRIRFADMTGDGLQDIVFISSGKVQYWPNLGYGRFGDKIVMRNSPRFSQGYDPAQVLLGDLDGDGLTDIVFVEDNRVSLFINRSGNSFSEAQVITGTPRMQSANATRITDILGTGQSGILWSYGVGEYTAGQMFFLDFTAGNKPYLLEEMNNNMGCLTRIKYGSSVYHYLRDEAKAETRWQTDLPFPVLVVNKTEVLDLLSGGKMTTEYIYHHGYWDGSEREFRGFARVDTRDTETFEKYNTGDLFSENFTQVSLEHYTPPTETRHWFYPGPVGDGYGKWFEPDFSHEYWLGDTSMFERSQEMKDLLTSLPKRARRDALRTLRGTMLRSELYGLDSTPLQNLPYTVTEAMMDLRVEFDPSQLPQPLWAESKGGYSSGQGYIFFPFSTAHRTTQWERGNDPMHGFNFTPRASYDPYGQVMGNISIGVPRGGSPTHGGQGEYLATYVASEYIYRDTLMQYTVNRVKRSVSYNATRNANGVSVFELRDTIFSTYASIPDNNDVINCVLNFYDGDPFVGLSYGEIGAYGALVRSESLIITDHIIDNAYINVVPECFKPFPDWSDGNGYPVEFANSLQNNDARLGYKDRRDTLIAYPNHIGGWYVENLRVKFGFHEASSILSGGLVLESKDSFDNISKMEYDDYFVFMIAAIDTLGATTSAEYDYRVMKAFRVTNSNLNISEFDFSPLGLLRATAVVGKGTEGDFVQNTGTFYERFAPSEKLEYNFYAFIDSGNPVWVQKTHREKYITDPDDTGAIIITRQYSDGFGRLLQTRTQAEDIIFGNQIFGSSGLPIEQNATNAPAIGIERNLAGPLNVTVSGWQIYNNQGKLVEQYEPFYSQGFEYTLPQASGMSSKNYYDPRGQSIRVVNPDKTEQRIIYGVPLDLKIPNVYNPTAWESYSYDANDLAEITHPGISTDIVPESHYYTPQSKLLDAWGRTIKTIDHVNNTNPLHADNIIMQYQYDVKGNLLQVTDPDGRIAFKYMYDFSGPQEGNNRQIRSEHLDSGVKTVVFDAMGKVIEGKNAIDATILNSYDKLHRYICVWTRDNPLGNFRLISYSIYGENYPLGPENKNLFGKLWKQYDEGGMLELVEYDFKSNLLEKKQYVISSTTLKDSLGIYQTFLVDWTGLPSILEITPFQMNNYYDALGRVVKLVLPSNVDAERKEITSSYNRSGALEKIMYDGDEYVKHIAYNAKGQRLLLAMANDVMIRYAYDPKSFRMVRQRSEMYTLSQVGNEYIYNYDNGNVRQNDGYKFDLVGNILKIMHRVSDCGINGTFLGEDALDRNFTYNSKYRLMSATGRESDTQNENDYIYSEATIPGVPNAQNVNQYTRQYTYDKLGNVIQMQQIGANAFTRKYIYNPGGNSLQKITTGNDALVEDYTYDNAGNQLTAGNTRNYSWSASGKLVAYYNQASGADPTIYAQYDYDSSGRRISKFVRTGTSINPIYERVIYIDGIFEYHVRDNGGTIEKNYIHIMDSSSCIATVRVGSALFPGDIPDDVTYHLNNQIGSCTVRLDISGTFIDIEEYYPFGDSSLRTFTLKRYRYIGKEKDLESGLYYYGARYYAAWTCRFISVDPLASTYAQLTPYNYADNNPINDFDIDGMQDGGSPQIPQNQQKEIIYGPYWLNPVKVTPRDNNINLFTVALGVFTWVTDKTYQLSKYVSPITIKPTFSTGTHDRFFGLKLSVGMPEILPYSRRYEWGATYFAHEDLTGLSGWEFSKTTRQSVGLHPLVHVSYERTDVTNNFGTSQGYATIAVGNPMVNISTYNDMKELGGDGGDRWKYGAGGTVNFFFFSAGVRLGTGDPGPSGERDNYKEDIGNGALYGTYIPTNGYDPDKYRMGIGYVGFMGIRVGRDSESIRDQIQNKWVHDHPWVQSAYFRALPIPARDYIQVGGDDVR